MQFRDICAQIQKLLLNVLNFKRFFALQILRGRCPLKVVPASPMGGALVKLGDFPARRPRISEKKNIMRKTEVFPKTIVFVRTCPYLHPFQKYFWSNSKVVVKRTKF